MNKLTFERLVELVLEALASEGFDVEQSVDRVDLAAFDVAADDQDFRVTVEEA